MYLGDPVCRPSVSEIADICERGVDSQRDCQRSWC
jgi:hypothetical protein